MKIENPYPIEAVAAFGEILQNTVETRATADITRAVDEYMRAYERPTSRYGGAVGVIGEHGSGKTHVLTIAARKLKEDYPRRPPKTAYAKVDAPRLFDIHRQVMKVMDPPYLSRVLHRTMREIGAAELRQARVTESASPRVEDAEDLTPFYEDGTLDRERLENLLQGALVDDGITSDIASAILTTLTPSAEAGYHWLLGHGIEPSGALGVTHSFVPPSDAGADIEALEKRAVTALQALALLHRLAKVPLIVFVDQLEVLLRVEPQRIENIQSLFKDLIEHFKRHSALIIVAGTTEGWAKFRPDVRPRFRTRNPIRVGQMTEQEVELLLTRYGGAAGEKTDPRIIALITELSGGSPREILRIAHYTVNRCGKLSTTTSSDVLFAATESSSVDDRAAFALDQIDGLLARHGSVLKDFRIEADLRIDRVLQRDEVPSLAVIVLKATDRISESGTARDVPRVRSVLKRDWPDVDLIVVSVGYSSADVRTLLKGVSSVVPFRDDDFVSTFESELSRLTARRAMERRVSEHADVSKTIDELDDRLATLEKRRHRDATQVAEQLRTDLSQLREAESQKYSTRTFWELLDAVDSLRRAVRNDEPLQERDLIRSILVTNDSTRRDSVVDELGGIYVEAVGLAVNRKSRALRELRERIAGDMRRYLTASSFERTMRLQPYRTAGLIGAGCGGIALVTVVLLAVMRGLRPYFWFEIVIASAEALILGIAVAGILVLWHLVTNPVRRSRRRLRSLEREDRSDLSEPSTT